MKAVFWTAFLLDIIGMSLKINNIKFTIILFYNKD